METQEREFYILRGTVQRQRLDEELAVIDSPTYEALHNPVYSLVANPWTPKYQNCNNFMLDVVGAAAEMALGGAVGD